MNTLMEVMSGYFEGSEKPGVGLLHEKKLPVSPREKKWKYTKEPDPSLSREFVFSNPDSYSFFLAGIAELEKKMAHHAEISCSYPRILVSVGTHDLKMVTDQDIKYSKKVTQIFRDARRLEEV